MTVSLLIPSSSVCLIAVQLAEADGEFLQRIYPRQVPSSPLRVFLFFKVSRLFFRKQLSAVDPGLYAERMLNFVMQHTDYPEIMDQRKKEQKSKAAFANKRKDLL